jgi:predicted ATPase/serine phosphatase RsbU (regulator of sigma subunit)/tRNA A-37 threonylcarbamoyl transferase component Bud32
MKIQNFGKFQILEQISESSKSIIYRANEKNSSETVVLKILKRDFNSSFQVARVKQEIQMVQNLNIEGIIGIKGMIQEEREIALILDDRSGISLKEFIKNRFITMDDFFKISIQLANTLSKIHSKNIIHKDIKPQNIIVSLKNDRFLNCYITDFGLSGIFQDEAIEIYNPKTIEGSLPYISPEQSGRMNLSVDYRSDIYSLGITFYELLTGSIPFISQDPLELIHSHIAIEPKPLTYHRSDIPEKINELVLKLIRKSPEDRYQSASGLLLELEFLKENINNFEKTKSFNIGSLDFSNRFVYPQKIFGRENEIQRLINGYESICNGERQGMIVYGSPGIGKSRVINEIQKEIVKSRGYFISGKYEQLRKDVPFGSIIQAFQELIRQILTESEIKKSERKEQILNKLGSSVQLINEIIPELEILVGKKEKLPELNSEENQNRFYHTFLQFLKTICNSNYPLVLFLDDLQWADQPSLNLIKYLLSDKKLRYFYPIFSYRDSEVSYSHPLLMMIHELRKENYTISEIHLEPLNIDHVKQLIEHLTGGRNGFDEVASIAFQKTGGNPFFLNQFIKTLYDEKIVTFETGLGWKWDFNRMNNLSVTDNVIDLMAAKIIKLSIEAQNLLKICSCIGNRFSIEFLSDIQEFDFEKTLMILKETIDEGLITPLTNSFSRITQDEGLICKFYHDRIQEAAYFLLSDDERKRYHSKIGSRYLTLLNVDKNENKIYYVTDQLNQAISKDDTFSQRKELSELNFRSGIRALESGAYQPAYKYFITGIELLEAEKLIWKIEYNLIFHLYLKALETSYLCYNYSETERYNLILIQHFQNLEDQVKIYEIMIKTYMAQHELKKAISLGLEILKKLNISFPKNPNSFHSLLALVNVKLKILFKKTPLTNLPLLHDSQILMATRIISALNSAAYWADPNLLPLLILRVVKLSIIHGNNVYSPYNYAGLGLILASLELYDSSYEMGLLSINLTKKNELILSETRTNFVFYTFIYPWKHSIRESIPKLTDCYLRSLQVGDIEFASHCALVAGYYSFLAGIELKDLEIEIQKYLQISIDLVQETDIKILAMYRQMVAFLQGEENFNEHFNGKFFNESETYPGFLKINDRTSLFHFHLNQLTIHYLFGNYKKALEYSEQLRGFLDGGLAVYAIICAYFYDSLARLVYLKGEIDTNKYYKFLKMVKSNLKHLKKAAKSAPMNFLGKALIVEAEIASLGKDFQKSVYLYEEAIRVCKENLFLQDYSLALELAGKFYIKNSLKKSAYTYLLQARNFWSLWGALSILESFDKRYPGLRDVYERNTSFTDETSSSHSLISNIDYSTIIKFSYFLSSEMDLNILVQRILSMAMENAGAHSGALILEWKGELSVIASGKSNSKVTTLNPIPIQNLSDIPISIVNYVWSTKENVILQEAYKTGLFTNDPYVKKKKVKSVICAPIIYKKKVSGILYLENNLVSHAFPPERIEMLSLLSSQAAISIDNAILLSQKEDSAKLSKEMEITAKIQSSLTPDMPTSNGYLISSYMKPAQSVGGDYYDIINTLNGDWFVIGDVSGHGILSGLIMMMVQTSIQILRSELDRLTPAQLLLKLILGIEDNIKKIAQSEFKYMTITIFKSTPDGRIMYSGQHQDLLIYRKEYNRIDQIPTEGVWIGLGQMLGEPENLLQDKEFILNSGDILLIYTDGITEGEDENGNALGVVGLGEILLNCKKTSPESIQKQILKSIQNYKSNDDISFMIIQKL